MAPPPPQAGLVLPDESQVRANASAFVHDAWGAGAREHYDRGEYEAVFEESLAKYEMDWEAWVGGVAAAGASLAGPALSAKLAVAAAAAAPLVAAVLLVYPVVRWLVDNTIPRMAGTKARLRYTRWVDGQIREALRSAGVPDGRIQAMRDAVAPALFASLAPIEAAYVGKAVEAEAECRADAWIWVADCPDVGVDAASRWFRPLGADVAAQIAGLVGALVRPEPPAEAVTDWWDRPRATPPAGGGLLAPLALAAAVWAGSRWL